MLARKIDYLLVDKFDQLLSKRNNLFSPLLIELSIPNTRASMRIDFLFISQESFGQKEERMRREKVD